MINTHINKIILSLVIGSFLTAAYAMEGDEEFVVPASPVTTRDSRAQLKDAGVQQITFRLMSLAEDFNKKFDKPVSEPDANLLCELDKKFNKVHTIVIMEKWDAATYLIQQEGADLSPDTLEATDYLMKKGNSKPALHTIGGVARLFKYNYYEPTVDEMDMMGFLFQNKKGTLTPVQVLMMIEGMKTKDINLEALAQGIDMVVHLKNIGIKDYLSSDVLFMVDCLSRNEIKKPTIEEIDAWKAIRQLKWGIQNPNQKQITSYIDFMRGENPEESLHILREILEMNK